MCSTQTLVKKYNTCVFFTGIFLLYLTQVHQALPIVAGQRREGSQNLHDAIQVCCIGRDAFTDSHISHIQLKSFLVSYYKYGNFYHSYTPCCTIMNISASLGPSPRRAMNDYCQLSLLQTPNSMSNLIQYSHLVTLLFIKNYYYQ